MEKTIFTPGPWTVKMPNRNLIKEDTEYITIRGDETHVATIKTGSLEYEPSKKAETNARLIAAAPELYWACLSAINLIKNRFPLEHGSPEIGEAWDALDRALAKAGGPIAFFNIYREARQ